MIQIYDIQGKKVTTLVDDFYSSGYYTISWDASKLSSGIYILNMNSGNFNFNRKLMLIK